jgi:hypothetical protein
MKFRLKNLLHDLGPLGIGLGVLGAVGLLVVLSEGGTKPILPPGPPTPPPPPPPTPKGGVTSASDFTKLYGSDNLGIVPSGSSLYKWENTILTMAQNGDTMVWPWTDVTLTDGEHTAVIKVQNDLFSIGTPDDYMRMPLRASTAQSIANLNGWMLPTPWLSYQIWKAAPFKIQRQTMYPPTVKLSDWAKQDAAVKDQIAKIDGSPMKGMVTGQKKDVVISNTFDPKSFSGAGNVVIYGWYNPAPDIFDDHGPIDNNPTRQPQQPNSGKAHDINYLDYSHGIRFIDGMAKVDGKDMPLVELYQHPSLWKLVSQEGPLKIPRYPATIPPKVIAYA